MKKECSKLVESYIAWLRTNMKVVDWDDFCEITTPFLDRHNDRLQIFVKKTEDGYRLTDDGYIISDLVMSGCELKSPQRRQILQTVLNGYGVKEAEGELFVETSEFDFAKKKHALIQAMINVNDMFVMAKSRTSNLFFEDVREFLESNEIRYSPTVDFIGKSGFAHKFDFLIPKSKNKPERLIKAIGTPTKQSAELLIFAWTDTKSTRPPDAIPISILDDTEKKPSSDFVNALKQYNITPILWSEREKHIPELAA